VFKEVLDGDLFMWGVLMQTQMVSQLNQFRCADFGKFSFGSVLVSYFLERVPLLSPHIFIGAIIMERASVDEKGACFG